ncbi:hypothetical protein KC614_04945, partial [candidate division WWE3 bacterium]|nr:hypothetical protein [candidate division WWE3 bacterium]
TIDGGVSLVAVFICWLLLITSFVFYGYVMEAWRWEHDETISDYKRLGQLKWFLVLAPLSIVILGFFVVVGGLKLASDFAGPPIGDAIGWIVDKVVEPVFDAICDHILEPIVKVIERLSRVSGVGVKTALLLMSITYIGARLGAYWWWWAVAAYVLLRVLRWIGVGRVIRRYTYRFDVWSDDWIERRDEEKRNRRMSAMPKPHRTWEVPGWMRMIWMFILAMDYQICPLITTRDDREEIEEPL